MPRSCASVIRATASPVVAMVSAADRYARILNAFSPLISSRSAISPSTCAIDPLSTRQPMALEGEVEQPGTAAGKRLADAGVGLGRTVTEQAAPAAGAADLGGGGTRGQRARDQVVDGG